MIDSNDPYDPSSKLYMNGYTVQQDFIDSLLVANSISRMAQVIHKENYLQIWDSEDRRHYLYFPKTKNLVDVTDEMLQRNNADLASFKEKEPKSYTVKMATHGGIEEFKVIGEKPKEDHAQVWDVIAWHVKKHESFRPFIYNCAAGYPTIGYGHRLDDDDYDEFRKNRISRMEANELFKEDFQKKINWAKKQLPDGYAMRHEQLALAMLAYNCKTKRWPTSTLRKNILKYIDSGRNPKYAKLVVDSWMKWGRYKHPRKGWITLESLEARREFETKIFFLDTKWIERNKESIRQDYLAKEKANAKKYGN